jgi:hypothetical protein
MFNYPLFALSGKFDQLYKDHSAMYLINSPSEQGNKVKSLSWGTQHILRKNREG